MPLMERKVTIAKCARCGHEWWPRQPVDEIKQCPLCRTKFWLNGKPKPQWQLKREDFELTDEE